MLMKQLGLMKQKQLGEGKRGQVVSKYSTGVSLLFFLSFETNFVIIITTINVGNKCNKCWIAHLHVQNDLMNQAC